MFVDTWKEGLLHDPLSVTGTPVVVEESDVLWSGYHTTTGESLPDGSPKLAKGTSLTVTKVCEEGPKGPTAFK